jgi:GMP synthase (glutamine-hydrolysing)
MNVRILLLQAREPGDPIGFEERRSFAEKAGIDEARIVPHDLLQGPPSVAEIRRFDALMVGGSGEYYVSRGDLPQFRTVLEVLAETVEHGHPTFASCFGFQLLVEALGGRVIHDATAIEVGTYELSLTVAGMQDELFGTLPGSFQAQLGRKDRAERLPPGVRHLASSLLCPYQAFRVPDKPIWTTQFHPEMNDEENRRRFLRYLNGYAGHMSPEEREEALQRFRAGPEATQLIRRFLDLVFG